MSGVFSGQVIKAGATLRGPERIPHGLAAVLLHHTDSQGGRPLGEGGGVRGAGVLLQ